MTNEKWVHAPISKIVETIKRAIKASKYLSVSIDLSEGDITEIAKISTEALASLVGEEICDECNGLGMWKENEQDNEVNCPKCKPSHPFEREVLEGYEKWKQTSSPYFHWKTYIDRYLAEKGRRDDKAILSK